MKNTFAFSDNILGVLMESELDDRKMEEIANLLEAKIKSNPSISIYLEDECKQGISFLGFLKSLSFHLSHQDSIRKVAIVTDLKWFQKAMDAKDLVIKADLKTFDISDRLKAMNWVME